MKRNNERKFMSVAIRNGSVCVLALGAVVGLATVGAASDDSLPTALGSAQLNRVASTPSGEETFLPEANIVIVWPKPLNSCCVPVRPVPDEGSRFSCVTPTSPKECYAKHGIPVNSCRCPEVLWSGNTEGEVDTMVDDSPVTEPAGASPIDTGSGSAWNLLVVTLFLASL